MRIGEKIEAAHGLYRVWGEALRADAAIARGLEELRARVESSRIAAAGSGIVGICRRCDEEEGGSCCGAGIEDRYTPELLLINLLIGVGIPTSRRVENSCFFLGGRGCLLAARDIICINYLCSRVCSELPGPALALLQETTGREMEAVFVLHDKIRNRTKRQAQ